MIDKIVFDIKPEVRKFKKNTMISLLLKPIKQLRWLYQFIYFKRQILKVHLNTFVYNYLKNRMLANFIFLGYYMKLPYKKSFRWKDLNFRQKN